MPVAYKVNRVVVSVLAVLMIATDVNAEIESWLRQSAEEGDASDQLYLGGCYHYGHDGVDLNKTEAAKWYRKAAEQGNYDAQHRLGKMYLHEIDSCDKQIPMQMLGTGRLVKLGPNKELIDVSNEHIETNWYCNRRYEEAGKWLKKSAEQGNPSSYYYLGYLYEFGHGLNKDEEAALKWYYKAAVEGDRDAKRSLERLKASN